MLSTVDVSKKIRFQLKESAEDGDSFTRAAEAACLRVSDEMAPYIDGGVRFAAFIQDEGGIELVFVRDQRRLTFEIDPFGKVPTTRRIDMAPNGCSTFKSDVDIPSLGDWLMEGAKA